MTRGSARRRTALPTDRCRARSDARSRPCPADCSPGWPCSPPTRHRPPPGTQTPAPGLGVLIGRHAEGISPSPLAEPSAPSRRASFHRPRIRASIRNCSVPVPKTPARSREPQGTTGTASQRPLTVFMLIRGRFRRWWQVLGSNQRRHPMALACQAASSIRCCQAVVSS
jgi:hypothetical protein